ncbi:MAG: DUF89 domain-containing protein [bacterium]
MKIHPDCRPCLIRQIESTARAACDDPDLIRRACIEAADVLEKAWDDELTPPEVSAGLYGQVARICGNDDPYLPQKIHFTDKALKLFPSMQEKVMTSADPFEAAVRMTIAGNIIDFGTGERRKEIDLEEVLLGYMTRPFFIDDFQELFEKSALAREVLYIGDNAGETVFDRLLLEMLDQNRLYYAVKGGGIINDATEEDARRARIHDHARIVDTGQRMPGTVPALCSSEFRKIWDRADLVISKGQGNFETLTELPREGRIFMLFIVKCHVVAQHLGASEGDMVVMKW